MMQDLPVGAIRANPDQPRKHFDPAKLEKLAASIRSNGLMRPIKVRPIPGGYELIAGERRWRAHKLLVERGQLPSGTIPAIIEEMGEQQRDIEAIVENLMRADVTPMEEARAFHRLVAAGMDVKDLAAKLGIQQSWRITDRLRLMNLAPELVHLFESGNLSANDVYEISRLERHPDQHRIVQMIRKGQISGYNAVRAAVLGIVEGLSRVDIFGGAAEGEAPKASEEELKTVGAMERKIEQIARMVQAGFHENEVVIARKVAPDKARLMAEQLELIRKHCLLMENQLRKAAAQGLLLAS